jgi:hypothetical protein
MNSKLIKQVEKISELELKLNESMFNLGLLREEQQKIVSKIGDIENAQTFMRTQLQDAYERMKEIILKEKGA